MSRLPSLLAASIALAMIGAIAPGHAAEKKPNILVIFGDDIGQANISVFTKGLMGYRTPNIDRLAKEGMLFTDYYAEQSCTAGRSSFITGQCVFRTGLSKVGLPAAPVGLQKEDPTIAELVKPLGYATGQFGKNHLGDRNEYLPTVHGFDEFFGNLYHLNAEEEPELYNYPQDPKFRPMFGPRGVLRCKATDKDDSTLDPRFGKIGKQTIEDTGPLTRKRMETIDDETSAAAIDFIQRQSKAGKAFFVWYNSTRMHLRTHVRPEHRSPKGATALTEYADGMIEHDGTVGSLLKSLDDLGIADNTIVIYTTDNGPHANTWPDGATTPFRSEKNTNWEGAFRVPCCIRWPGHIKPDSVSNEIVSGLDWLPTLVAAAGDPDVKQKLLRGYTVGETTYKVHLDGYNLLPYLTGRQGRQPDGATAPRQEPAPVGRWTSYQENPNSGVGGTGWDPKSPRREFFYFSDDCDLLALRYENWKFVFAEQRKPGTLAVWSEPFTRLRMSKLFDLRADPYERADITSNTYYDWELDHAFLVVPSQAYVVKFIETFKEFPPRQKPASFGIDQALETLQRAARGG